MTLKKQAKTSLGSMLISLTALFITAQCIFFTIHYHVSELVDTLANQDILHHLLQASLLLPLIGFLLISLLSYAVLTGGIWFTAVSLGGLLRCSDKVTYGLGLACWALTCMTLFSLNHAYFPHSFFAQGIEQYASLALFSRLLGCIAPPLLGTALLLAYFHFFFLNKQPPRLVSVVGYFILTLGFTMGTLALLDTWLMKPHPVSTQERYPHLILIGLDSLRPDHTHYFGRQINTPEIDHFLQNAAVFTRAYTPLARTFPSWMGILTAKHPIHHHARANLTNPALIIKENTLSATLQQAGFDTFYATDERRFSNITKAYGFNHIIGPAMGANDFLLGGLNDFPLNNLLIHSPLGRWLFPYHYGNRAAHLTYYPDDFLRLVNIHLQARDTTKPLFLAIHLCLSHWPYTWAKDGQTDELPPHQYQSSVEEVDKQLGRLLHLLKENGLLQHSLVVLLSDHGTTLGLPNDRTVAKGYFQGKQQDLSLISISKLSLAPKNNLDIDHSFSINTSYGQGSDVLSLKQYQVLLAFRGFGLALPVRRIQQTASLMDIAPTLLNYLHLAPLAKTDGMTLMPYLSSVPAKNTPRPIIIETADRLSDIETDKIDTQKVLQKGIGAYRIDPDDGSLFLSEAAASSIIQNKQRAVLLGSWLLAHYPAETRLKFEAAQGKSTELKLTPYPVPPYWVLVNTETKRWTIGLTSPFARKAPVRKLRKMLLDFYGGELTLSRI